MMDAERRKRRHHREPKGTHQQQPDRQVTEKRLPLGWPQWVWEAIATVGLIVVTLVAYIPAMQAGYIWDDDAYVLNNLTLRSADGLRRIWFQISATPQYYPLVHTTYWLEYHLWGLDPTGYHVVNILLHAAGAVLLWRILKLLQVPGAWAAAVVFALHPVHVESVAWITERKNVLSGLFYLGSALTFLRYALLPDDGSGDKRSGRLYVLSLMLFLCALFSKTVTSTLPAALLLVLWWKRNCIRWIDVRALTPFFVIGLPLALLTVLIEKNHVGALGTEWNLSLIERILIAGRALWFYAGKLLWPIQLTFNYPRWEIDAGAWAQHLFPAGILVAVVTLWLNSSRIGKGPLVAVLFFGGTMVPALGFFDVYPMRYSFVADHFQYLASVGLITLVTSAGYLLAIRLSKGKDHIATIALTVILATLGTLTWKQGHTYKDLETLWRDTLSKNPKSWIAHNNLGNVLLKRGELGEAIKHYREALRIDPAYVRAHTNLGYAMLKRGELGEAIKHYREALRIDPAYAHAHFNLGNAMLKRGELGEAIKHYRQVLRINPAHAEAHNNLGHALLKQGKPTEATEHFCQALRLGYALAEQYLARALARLGEREDAVNRCREPQRNMQPRPAASVPR